MKSLIGHQGRFGFGTPLLQTWRLLRSRIIFDEVSALKQHIKNLAHRPRANKWAIRSFFAFSFRQPANVWEIVLKVIASGGLDTWAEPPQKTAPAGWNAMNKIQGICHMSRWDTLTRTSPTPTYKVHAQPKSINRISSTGLGTMRCMPLRIALLLGWRPWSGLEPCFPSHCTWYSSACLSS